MRKHYSMTSQPQLKTSFHGIFRLSLAASSLVLLSVAFPAQSFLLRQGCTHLTLTPNAFFPKNQFWAITDDTLGNDDVEQARQRLEQLLGGDAYSADTSVMSDRMVSIDFQQEPPHLTAMGRIRRTTEIKLLEQVRDSKEAIDALNSFWFSERGVTASKNLQRADDIFQQGESSWVQAEELFRALIVEHGIYWVEPLHRLAMLYYLQGRHDEALKLEQTVLKIKPWHIGALSHHVRISAALEDVDAAIRGAARRLPTKLGRRRKAWAGRAVQTALDLLAEEDLRLKKMFEEHDEPSEEGLSWQ